MAGIDDKNRPIGFCPLCHVPVYSIDKWIEEWIEDGKKHDGCAGNVITRLTNENKVAKKFADLWKRLASRLKRELEYNRDETYALTERIIEEEAKNEAAYVQGRIMALKLLHKRLELRRQISFTLEDIQKEIRYIENL